MSRCGVEVHRHVEFSDDLPVAVGDPREHVVEADVLLGVAVAEVQQIGDFTVVGVRIARCGGYDVPPLRVAGDDRLDFADLWGVSQRRAAEFAIL